MTAPSQIKFIGYKALICKKRGARCLRAPLSGPEVPPTGPGYAENARNFPATFTITGNPSKVDSLLSFCAMGASASST